MLVRFYILLLSTFVISCSDSSTAPDTSSTENIAVEDEVTDINAFDLVIEQSLLNAIQKDLNSECYQSGITIYEEDQETVLDQGVIFFNIAKDTAVDAFNKYSEQVRAEGNYLFLTSIDYDKDWNEFYDVVILPCEDQFSLIEMIATEGIGTDVTNEQIVANMKKWDAEVGFNTLYCDNSGVDAYMDHMPEDIEQFSKEVTDFCPYIIEEDAGSMEAYIQELEEKRYFYLWWGVSFR